MFNWKKLFENKGIHDQLKLFNETFLNIAHSYIPNKCITCNDKDPHSLLDQFKRLVKRKTKYLRSSSKTDRPNSHYENLQTTRTDLTEVMGSSKNSYYERLVNNLDISTISPKTYWSIIKTLVNFKKLQLYP